MNDDLEQFEAELRRRRPTALSPALVDRIRRELVPRPSAAKARRSFFRERWWAVALPLAAAAGFVATLALRPVFVRLSPPKSLNLTTAVATVAPAPQPSPLKTAPAATNPLTPMKIENVLFSAQDEGLVRLEDGSAARRQRLRFIDTIVWKNPESNTSLVWTLPREEIRVIRVTYY